MGTEKVAGNRSGRKRIRPEAESETAEREAPAAEPTTRVSGGRPRREKLTPQQLRGIDALLSRPTTAAAAEEIGVSPRTISWWFKEPAFARSTWRRWPNCRSSCGAKCSP